MNREKLAFVFIGLLLFILGFDALMIVHYVKNLSGPSLIAVASILAGTFLAIYAAWFCCKPNASKPLKLAAFASKIVLIIVGGLSATAIITLYFHQKAQAKAAEAVNLKEATHGQAQIAVIQAQSAANTQQMEGRRQQIAQIEATATNLQKTLGRAAARKFVEEEMAKLPPVAPSATPTPDLLATAQAVNDAEVKKEESHTVKAWLLEYADSGVYYVPTIANLFVFIGLCAFLMFGPTVEGAKPAGAEGNKQPAGFTSPMQPHPTAARQGTTTITGGSNFTSPRQ